VLLPGVNFFQIVPRQQHTTGDIAVVAGRLEIIHETDDPALEDPLLLAGDAGPLVEGHLGNDVALGEAAVVDEADRQGVPVSSCDNR